MTLRPRSVRYAAVQRHFEILEARLSLSGPPEVVGPLAFAYRRFLVPGAAAGGSIEIALDDAADELRVNGRVLPLVGGLDPQVQLQQHFQAALMDAVGSCAVLHAGALVDREGRGFLLAAPSGHGKSSLTLELLRRGYGFLSDDYAPLDLEPGLVRPFPRAVAVRPGARSPIPEPFRTEARSPAAPRMFGKSLLDVGQVLGDEVLASGPVPLGNVLLLASEATPGAGAAATRVGIAVRPEHAAEYEERFAATPGVEILRRCATAHLHSWYLRLDHAAGPTEALAGVIDGEKTVLFEKRWDPTPDFGAAPSAAPVGRREAAESLGREMLNRRTGGALLERYGGSVARLFLDLAGALRQASCWRVHVGEFRGTADVVERLVADRSPVSEIR